MTMWRGVLLIVAPACMAGCATPSYTVGVPVDGTLPDDHPRIYVAGKVHTPLIIDGKLDEAVWATAPRTELYLDIEGDHMPTPDWDTRCAMVWDETYFYFAAWLDEPHLWSTLTERDAIIYRDNDWEIFIDPDGDQVDYLEYEVNVLGTVFDLKLTRGYRWGGTYDIAWNFDGMKSAVHTMGTVNDPSDTDRGWTVEVAIPWACMKPHAKFIWCPPHEGDIWFVNFSRVQWPLEVVDGNYRKVEGEREDNWVWSPQYAIDMHRPEYWGHVQFSDAAPGEAAFKPNLDTIPRTQLRRIQTAIEQFRAEHDALPASMDDIKGMWTPMNDSTLSAPEYKLVDDSFEVYFTQTRTDVCMHWWLGPDMKLRHKTIR